MKRAESVIPCRKERRPSRACLSVLSQDHSATQLSQKSFKQKCTIRRSRLSSNTAKWLAIPPFRFSAASKSAPLRCVREQERCDVQFHGACVLGRTCHWRPQAWPAYGYWFCVHHGKPRFLLLVRQVTISVVRVRSPRVGAAAPATSRRYRHSFLVISKEHLAPALQRHGRSQFF